MRRWIACRFRVPVPASILKTTPSSFEAFARTVLENCPPGGRSQRRMLRLCGEPCQQDYDEMVRESETADARVMQEVWERFCR